MKSILFRSIGRAIAKRKEEADRLLAEAAKKKREIHEAAQKTLEEANRGNGLNVRPSPSATGSFVGATIFTPRSVVARLIDSNGAIYEVPVKWPCPQKLEIVIGAGSAPRKFYYLDLQGGKAVYWRIPSPDMIETTK